MTVSSHHRDTAALPSPDRRPPDGSADPDGSGGLGAPPLPDDLADRLAERLTRRRLPVLPLTLGAAVLLGIGFIAGAQQRTHGATTASAPAAGRMARAGGRPAGAGSGGASEITAGTVKLVDGRNVYVQTAAGGTVKIHTTRATKVTLATSGSVSRLKPGDTVLARTSAGDGGAVSASSISEGSGAALGGRRAGSGGRSGGRSGTGH